MNRRAFLVGLGTGIQTAPLAAEARPASIEGQNILIEYRSAEGRLERLPDLEIAQGIDWRFLNELKRELKG
jgi:hypothetical protein